MLPRIKPTESSWTGTEEGAAGCRVAAAAKGQGDVGAAGVLRPDGSAGGV